MASTGRQRMHWMFCGIALHSFQINKSAYSYCV